MEKKLKSKVLIKTSFSLFLSLLSFLRLNYFSLFLILSATAFFLLSLSFSFSLRPPSFFFLSLSHSLWHPFSLLSLSFSVPVSPHRSWFHLLHISQKKKDYGDGFYFFWALLWSSFSVHHYHFFFFTGFNWRLQRHASEICRSSIHFCCGYLFFLFHKLTGIFLYVFSKDLMVSLVDLIFQVFKCLKWRVQPQTSFLSSKKPSMEMLFLFFLHFICSSSSVHHVCFVYKLQLTLKKTCIWDLSFICPFLLWISFFFGFSS